MPAFLQSFIEAEQERSRRIEQLRKEIREFAKEEAGSSITEQILLFLAELVVFFRVYANIQIREEKNDWMRW